MSRKALIRNSGRKLNTWPYSQRSLVQNRVSQNMSLGIGQLSRPSPEPSQKHIFVPGVAVNIVAERTPLGWRIEPDQRPPSRWSDDRRLVPCDRL